MSTLEGFPPAVLHEQLQSLFLHLAPSNAPTSVQGIPLNATTLFMLWQAPQSHHHNGIITAYHVLLREVQTDSTTLHVLTSNTTSTVISDLHPSYQYEVQVAAVTVAIGPYSNTAVIQLPESGTFTCSCSHCASFVFLLQHQVDTHCK